MSKEEAQVQAYLKIKDIKECEKCRSTKNLVRHHCDYSKPLDVIILCRKCHSKWHNKNKAKHSDDGTTFLQIKSFPEDLKKILQMLAIDNHTSLKEELIEAVIQYLSTNEEKVKKIIDGEY